MTCQSITADYSFKYLRSGEIFSGAKDRILGFTSNMGQTGPFDNEGMYAELAMVEDAMLLPHRTVGVALDEMRFVNREREIAKLPQRKKRYNILNRFFPN